MSAPQDSARGSVKSLGSIADFELRECLRAGELAEVYRAWDRVNERWVTLARLRPEVALRPGVGDHFLHAASQVSTIAHPSLVPLAFGSDELGIGFVLEPEQSGESLDQMLADSPGGLPLRDAIALLEPVAEALALAHARGVAHGQVTADTIVVADEEAGRVPKLKGFGLSDSSELASRPPERMHSVPPECIAGRAADPAADVYSLAALLYELIAGEPPPSEDAALSEVTEVPAELSRMVARCLARRADDRPTARALHGLLARLKDGAPVARRATPLAMRAVRAPLPPKSVPQPVRQGEDMIADLAAELGAVLSDLERPPLPRRPSSRPANDADEDDLLFDLVGSSAPAPRSSGISQPAPLEEPVFDTEGGLPPAVRPKSANDAGDDDDLVFDTVDSPAPPKARRPASRRSAPVGPEPDLEFDMMEGSAPARDAEGVSDDGEFMLGDSSPAPGEGASDSLRPLSSLPPDLQQALRGEVPGGLETEEPAGMLEFSLPPPRSAPVPSRPPKPPTRVSRPGAERSMPPPLPAVAHSQAPRRTASAPVRPSARSSGRASAPTRPPTPPPLPLTMPSLPGLPGAASRAPSLPKLSAPAVSRPPALPSRRSKTPTVPATPPRSSKPTAAAEERSPTRPPEPGLGLREAALLLVWTLAFGFLAPLYYAGDFGALDALLGFGRLTGLLFLGASVPLVVRLWRVARGERDHVFSALWYLLAALLSCAGLMLIAALDAGLLPGLLLIAARMAMSWGVIAFLVALAIASTRRILSARRDSWQVVVLLSLLTLGCLGGTAWLITRAHRIDAGQSTRVAYGFGQAEGPSGVSSPLK